MEYTTLGNTGAKVSRIGVGCNSFGDGAAWMLDEDESREIIDRAVELGVTFFDNANSYSDGTSERILGSALGEYDRDRLFVATKVFFPLDPDDPNSGGLSRKAIDRQLSASLDRLDMDAVDLYQIHRWDEETPIERTLRTLDDAVRRGAVRYVGASSMWAHQLAEALHVSETRNLTSFATMQNHYNLAYREEEREVLPLCRREGLGVIPWGPLARGFLARPHDADARTVRAESDALVSERGAVYRDGGGEEINERVADLADEKGVTMAQLSLAWLLHKDGVDAPIVGVTSVDHLEQAVAAVDVSLSDADLEYLEAPYRPVPVVGHE
jgi:aryl-alcohol dehydrogenase-like predicted oxidoreductase